MVEFGVSWFSTNEEKGLLNGLKYKYVNEDKKDSDGKIYGSNPNRHNDDKNKAKDSVEIYSHPWPKDGSEADPDIFDTILHEMLHSVKDEKIKDHKTDEFKERLKKLNDSYKKYLEDEKKRQEEEAKKKKRGALLGRIKNPKTGKMEDVYENEVIECK